MPVSALGYVKDGRVRPEQSVKQAAADAEGLLRVIIVMLMWCVRSQEQRGSLLGAK